MKEGRKVYPPLYISTTVYLKVDTSGNCHHIYISPPLIKYNMP
jgi:hypothetical protein